MSRDLAKENYYISHGGQIPVKWTAPEVIVSSNGVWQKKLFALALQNGTGKW